MAERFSAFLFFAMAKEKIYRFYPQDCRNAYLAERPYYTQTLSSHNNRLLLQAVSKTIS